MPYCSKIFLSRFEFNVQVIVWQSIYYQCDNQWLAMRKRCLALGHNTAQIQNLWITSWALYHWAWILPWVQANYALFGGGRRFTLWFFLVTLFTNKDSFKRFVHGFFKKIFVFVDFFCNTLQAPSRWGPILRLSSVNQRQLSQIDETIPNSYHLFGRVKQLAPTSIRKVNQSLHV